MLRRLGEGATGIVFEAFDTEQNAHVALKVLHDLHADALIRFKHEFRAMRDLRHPNLVALGELFQDAGRWFFTMEFVQGVDFLHWVMTERSVIADQPTALLGLAGATPSALQPSVASEAAPPRFDEARLRSALLQLSRGLCALHGAGKVHRDIKPSNVLVKPDGQVVILDFGLVINVDDPEHVTGVDQVVGTAAFMAPEQAAAAPAHTAADWYAVGVMLYVALTGRLPYLGSAVEVLLAKRDFDANPPRMIVATVPPDLDALCTALLRRDPRERPTGDEIARQLGGEPAADTSVPRGDTQFVGRLDELAALQTAFEDTRRGNAVVVCITGDSGVGKSALARHFADDVASQAAAIVLAGSCHEREAVPYRGIDGIIDSLAKHMARLPAAQAAALLPLQAALLPHVFSVLGRVGAIAEAPAPLRELADPRELRREVFAALRDLLTRLARRAPLVLLLDDIQWIDADGVALLREVLRVPDPPPLLLLTTARVAPANETVLPGLSRQLELRGLPSDDARRLAALLLAGTAPQDTIATTIARESGGHPFFIRELVRQATHAKAPTLQEAIRARIESLDADARRIMEIVSVAGAPLAEHVAAEAAALELSEFARHAAALRAQNLVRMSGARHGDVVEAYHDRVATAVLALLDAGAQRACHGRLALALEGSGDAEALATHWRGAGKPDRAAPHEIEAAELAARALAFDRAARLYRSALDGNPPSHEGGLRVRLAEALANAGRGAEAAQEYLRAAELISADAIDLHRRAGQELLMTGHIDDGLDVLRTVLQAIGMRLAKTPQSAIPALLLRRAQIRVRGLRFDERPEIDIPVSELRRIDVCYAIATGLAIDTIRGAHFQTRHLLLALRAGEPNRVARALASEVAYSATAGSRGRTRTERLLRITQKLADRLNNPSVFALLATVEGMSAFLAGQWRDSRDHCLRGEHILREQCTGMTLELAGTRLFFLRSLYYLGDVAELSRRLPELRRDARELGNQHTGTQLSSGILLLDFLARDEPEHARAAAAEAIAQWSQRGTHVTHFTDLIGGVHIDLYCGAGLDAYRRFSERAPAIVRARLTRVQLMRVNMLDLHARVALAAAALRTPETGARLAEAEQCGRRLWREDVPWAQATARLIQACVAAARGQTDAAARWFEDAAGRLDDAQMALHAAVARRRLGELLGGDSGRGLVAASDEWMARQMIQRPDRVSDLLAPSPR